LRLRLINPATIARYRHGWREQVVPLQAVDTGAGVGAVCGGGRAVPLRPKNIVPAVPPNRDIGKAPIPTGERSV